MRCIVLLLLPTLLLCRLPPGYEDELFCRPENACLRPRHHPSGWSGAATAQFDCYIGYRKIGPPRGWGEKLGAEYRQQLMRGGWRVAEECRDGKMDAGMERVVDRMLGLAALW